MWPLSLAAPYDNWSLQVSLVSLGIFKELDIFFYCSKSQCCWFSLWVSQTEEIRFCFKGGGGGGVYCQSSCLFTVKSFSEVVLQMKSAVGIKGEPEAAGGVTMGNFPNPARAPIPSCAGSRAESDIWLLIISLLILQFVRHTQGKINKEA